MRIHEILESVEPEYKVILLGMVENVPNNMNATVNDVFNHFAPFTQLNRDEKLALLSLTKLRSNKFAPKMSYSQRCEVLALFHKGVPRDALAKMYNVDRRTVTHIYTVTSPHYKNVRDERIGIGEEEFRNRYLTNDLITTALSFMQKTKSDSENNPNANKKQGLHLVRGQFCTYDHRVIISWREPANTEGIEVAGWHYCDLDSDLPNQWFTAGGPNSLKTSQSCYSAMLEDITDKLE